MIPTKTSYQLHVLRDFAFQKSNSNLSTNLHQLKMAPKRRSKKSSTKTTSQKQLCMVLADNDKTISSKASNHFGYSQFELKISLNPAIKNKKFDPQPLTVKLVFEDGKQIDSENKQNKIPFKTTPKSLFINKNGECKFNVQIDTYSIYNDNKAFKLVFKLSAKASRHIGSCETKPFHLVKNRLEINKPLEDTFYKDEGGRSNFLRCEICLKDCVKNTVKNRDIPLTGTLLYEDFSIVESSHDILELLTSNIILKQGKCHIDFRINEVSKNHCRRAFRVLFECNNNDPLYNDISACITKPIMVKSKRTKKKTTPNRKRKRKKPKTPSSDEETSVSNETDYFLYSDDDLTVKKQKHESLNPIANVGDIVGQMKSFCTLAEKVMNKLEWNPCGYEFDDDSMSLIDTNRPIFRCVYCLKYRNKNGWGQHEQWCQLNMALYEYGMHFKGGNRIMSVNPGQVNELPPAINTGSLPTQSQTTVNINGPWPFGPGALPMPNEIFHYQPQLPQDLMPSVNGDINIHLPNMHKIATVSRIRSQYGYDAFDENNKFVGVFNDQGQFMDANVLDRYSPPKNFDPSQMIARNESNDMLFYDNIRSNIFGTKWG
eukprot:463228_1